MTLLPSPCTSRCDFSPQLLCFLPSLCPCKIDEEIPRNLSFRFVISCPRRRTRRKRRNGYLVGVFPHENSRPERMNVRTCMVPTEGGRNNLNLGPLAHSARPRTKSFIVKQMASSGDNLYRDHLDQSDILSQESSSLSSHMGTGPMSSRFTNFQEDPIVDKLRTQLGVIHQIPAPPISQRNIVGLFVFFFFVGVAFDKLWTSRKRNKSDSSVKGRQGTWPQVPTSFSLFLEKDLQRKESVEWVNMVLGKLWKVYRSGLENWIIGLLQPVIDNLKKPDYVQRVEIKQFSLGDEPLSVRNVERKTSRRVNDLQYHIGLRYTGGARMLLMLSLSFSIIPVVVPVGVRDFDIDGELWVKLRLIPSEPWVGAVSWAFVSLPKIKFELSPFRLFNLMAIPVLSMFLTKLLTEDLPRLFVRPKKIVLDFQKGKAVGPVPIDFKSGEAQEGNKDFVGELSVTLVDAQKLSYIFGKTDPYVILSLGDQVVRSKKNSQTTVTGPPGEPIWNQDFHMLVVNPGKQKLHIQVKDSLGFTDFTVGSGEVDLGSLEDTVPTDRIVVLRGGWRIFSKQSCGEILLRLTYKAYVEDEEDESMVDGYMDTDASDDELSDPDESATTYQQGARNLSDGVEKESFMDVLAALIVSEEFQGIVASETGNIKTSGNANRIPSTSSRSREVGTKPSSPDGGSEGFGGSALFWLVVITSMSVLIATNIGGSSLFNP